ncbi:MAG: hypothetical protein H6716_03660 [Polyangiaceae bacterium]|nr:hypothetical protein [Polyangiaceae bacterium]
MRPLDTAPAAHTVQLRLYRQMSPEQRSALALRMSDEIREIAAAGIRQRHPEYTEAEVRRALVCLLYGRESAQRVWPDERVPAA